MDTVRRRYGNASVRRGNYRYDVPAKAKPTYVAKVIKQAIACAIVGTLIVNVGSDAVIGSVRYVLGYSVEYSVALENMRKVYNKIMGITEVQGGQDAPI